MMKVLSWIAIGVSVLMAVYVLLFFFRTADKVVQHELSRPPPSSVGNNYND
jgi:hypothetical protein